MNTPAIQDLSQWMTDHLVVFILVLTRLSTLLMAMPAVGTGVPRRARAMLALMLTVMMVPAVTKITDTQQIPPIENLVELCIAIGREALVGMLIGATVQLIITGMQLGGEVITGTGGMQLGDAIDPTSQSSMPAIARLVGMLITAVLLMIGGHRLMLELLIESYTELPVGNFQFKDTVLETIVDQWSAGIVAGIQVAAPVVGALLLANFVTGLISRTLPQINVLAIGLSINALALLVVTSLVIGAVGYVFQNELEIAVDRLRRTW